MTPLSTNCTEELAAAAALSMPVRIYRAEGAARGAPIVLHLHGGAFVSGSLDSGRTIATILAEAGAVVVSAAYPLAPAHPFPRALEGTYATLAWLYKSRAKWAGRHAPVFIAGEEAGGNLAAGLALMARDRQGPPLAGQILLSPMLDPCMATCSVRQAEAGPVGCKWADGWHQYLGSAEKAAHPYASPVGSSRLSGLAPALVLTAEDDLLRDEGHSYARRLRESGVAVDEHVLSAPTGWPEALDRPPPADAAWVPALRAHFAAFFAQTLAAMRSTISLRPIHV